MTPARTVPPVERLEAAMNAIVAVVVGHLDQVSDLPGGRRQELLRRMRSLNSHLGILERALAGRGSDAPTMLDRSASGW